MFGRQQSGTALGLVAVFGAFALLILLAVSPPVGLTVSAIAVGFYVFDAVRGKGYSMQIAAACGAIPIGWLIAAVLPYRTPAFLKFKEELPPHLRASAVPMWREYQRMLGDSERQQDLKLSREPDTEAALTRQIGRERIGPEMVVLVGAILLAVVLLFPPFYVTLLDGISVNLGRSFFLSPPKYGALIGRVDALVLIAEALGIALITAMVAMYLILSDRRRSS